MGWKPEEDCRTERTVNRLKALLGLGQRPHQREARYSVVPGVVEAAGAAGHRSVLTQESFIGLRDGAE